MNRSLILIAVTVLLLSGCGQKQSNEKTFAQAYAAAEEALTQAQDRGNVWSNTQEMLQDSNAAFTDGRVDDAIHLATEARLQAELAIEQADTEKTAWHSRALGQ